MEELKVFQNSEFGELGVLTIGGKEYFPATQCAKVLGYSDPYKAVKAHCKPDGWANRPVIDNMGRTQEKKYITEGNLYRLIVGSRLPAAERFERWVFDEVLPSIRKTGGYGNQDITAVITQTATAICSEMVKQLLPALRNILDNQADEEMTITDVPMDQTIKRRKRSCSTIAKLCPELRNHVEEMLCSGRYTYSDVVSFLGREGVRISASSVCQYAKKNGCYMS